MTFLPKKSLPIMLSVMVLGSANVHASNCAEDSPLKRQLGDKYPEHDMGYVLRELDLNRPSSEIDQQDLDLIDTLTNGSFKQGSGIRYRCKGTDERSQIETTKFVLEDVELIESNNGRLAIKAWENSDRKIKSSSISLAPPKLWRKTNDGTATNIILTRVENPYLNDTTGGLLGINYYYLNGYVYKPADFERENLLDYPDRSGYHLKEIRTIIQQSRKGITLTQSIFINGERAEWVVWNLQS
jgi:hypothetical protein